MTNFKTNLLAAAIALTVSGVALADSATDTAITNQISAKYAGNSGLSKTNIEVDTSDNVVSLSGEVNNQAQYKEAIILAEGADNVKDVNADDLKVKGDNSSLEDTYITSKVEGVLLKNAVANKADVRFSGIKVVTKNGVVYLSGLVDNNTQRQNVINITQTVEGVKSVNSSLKVK